MSTGFWVTLSVLLVLLLLGLLRTGVIVEYSQEGLGLIVRFGSIRIAVLPRAKTNREKRTKDTSAQAKKPSGGLVKTLVQLLPDVLETVKKLFHHLRSDKLELQLTVSSPDPADTAIAYGQANALLASLWHPLTQVLDVEDGHAHVDMDYEAGRSSVYLYVSVYLRLWQLLTLAVVLVVKVIRIFIKNRSVWNASEKDREVV